MTTPTRTYLVPGMTCEHCRDAITAALATVPDVDAVDVQLDAKELRIAGTADEAAVRRAVEDAGYDVAGVR